MRFPTLTRSHWLWLGAMLLMLAEFLVFDRMTSRHHASIYPRWNDQIQYLTESYQGYEVAKTQGLWAGLHTTIANPAAQGTLHDVLAMLVFLLVGSPSRSAALSLNMLAFLGWQVSLLAVFRRLSGSWTIGWMAFALLPCLYWPWSAEAGSAVDFRLDHAAMCLLGVCSAVALLTRGFRSLGWSAGLGFVIGITLLERFLTGAYFAAIFIFSAGWIICGDQKVVRLRNLLLAGLIAAVLIGPVLWLNWTTIYNYYWVGHISGTEAAARAPGLAAWESAQYIFGHFTRMQLGAWFGWVAAGLTAPLVYAACQRPAAAAAPAAASPTRQRLDRDWLFFSLAFLLLPALIMGFHKQKSAYVLGVLAPGTLLLIGWIWATLWPRALAATPSGRAWRLWPAALAAAGLLAGGVFFINRQLWQPHSAEFLEGARRVNQLASHFFTTSRSAGLATPNLGVDQVTDSLDAQIMRVVTYERKKVWLPYQMQLPTGILAEKDEVIYARLAQCDFVLLTDEMPGHGFWPFDQQMRQLYPGLKQWCDLHLRLVESFPIFGRQMSLYQRRELP